MQRRVTLVLAAAALAALLIPARTGPIDLSALLAAACLAGILLVNHFSEASRDRAVRAARSGWQETRRKLHSALDTAEGAVASREAADRTKNEFLAHMSHELRTPLNGVIGMARLLLGTELNHEQQGYAEAIKNQSEALVRMISDILDFSKIEAGKMRLEKIPFDLRVTVDDIIDMFAVQLSDREIQLKSRVAADIPSLVRGDPGRLRQVLINLIGNAVKFTENGEITLTVERGGDDDRGDMLRFSVADTGIGIAPEQMASLFDPYQQANTATARKYGGTGLGLSIAKQLVENMDGEIGVDSTPGAGSTFWFTAALENQPAHEHPVHDIADDIQGVPVLVVDDNPTNRRMLKALLVHWGCIYEEAASAESALSKLQDAAGQGRPFRIVILDAEISGSSGEAVGRRILEASARHRPRLIMLTSLGSRGDAARLERAGFSAYLTRPVKQHRLHECLRTLNSLDAAREGSEQQKILTRHTLEENRRRRLRILLVEDDVVNRKVARTLLERLGLHPDTAANGSQAISAVEAQQYDLILMDCVMPVMDGFDATRRIREKTDLRQMPIIAMTAHTGREIQEKCRASGMNDCISKPLTAAQLTGLIEQWTRVCGSGEIMELPQVPVSPQAVFDKAGLINRLMGDEDFARELAVAFLRDLPRRRTLLASAAEGRDAEAVRLEAHSLKGSATSLSAPALQEIASRIETAAAEGKTEAARRLLRDLDTQIQHLKNALILSKLISLDEC